MKKRWSKELDLATGESRWINSMHGLEITVTKHGEYRLWDTNEVDTVGIFCKLAEAKAAGDERIDRLPKNYLVENEWTKENYDHWVIRGLAYVDEDPWEGFPDMTSEDTTIHPGLHETCSDVLSLINGIHGQLYDQFQIDDRLKDGDTFTVPPTDIFDWSGKLKYHLPRLDFETFDQIHIVPSRATRALIKKLKAENEKDEKDAKIFDLAGKAHSQDEVLDGIAKSAPYYDLAGILKDMNHGICRHQFNRENWSGKEAVVAGRWEDMHFTIRHLPEHTFRLEVEDAGEGTWVIRSDQYPDDYSLGLVSAPSGSILDQYRASSWALSREGGCPFEAAAKLICNTL